MIDIGWDAVLLLGFGGPEGPDDVLPFLRNVTRGRDVPDERLAEVARQYELFGGRSPINDQHAALRDALQAELSARGRDVPVHVGNRNWQPYVEDVVAALVSDGHERILVVATAAYSSYSSCRQYHEDVVRAVDHVVRTGRPAPTVRKLRPFWNHPGFVEAAVDRTATAFAAAPSGARLVCTAHSIPEVMAAGCDYEAQLREVAGWVADGSGAPAWDLVFQSRSGPPHVPWLGPDIGDHLRTLAAQGVDSVVVAPIGFLSDHVEVLFDLDTQAAAIAEEVGLTMVRAETVGTHPTFVAGLADLLDEQLVGAEPRSLGTPRPQPCPPDCCPLRAPS